MTAAAVPKHESLSTPATDSMPHSLHLHPTAFCLTSFAQPADCSTLYTALSVKNVFLLSNLCAIQSVISVSESREKYLVDPDERQVPSLLI